MKTRVQYVWIVPLASLCAHTSALCGYRGAAEGDAGPLCHAAALSLYARSQKPLRGRTAEEAEHRLDTVAFLTVINKK